MMELLQSLMSQVDRMEASSTATTQLLGVVPRGRQQLSSTTTLQVPITYHRCGQMGHSAIRCACRGQMLIQLEN